MRIFWINPNTREFLVEGLANESPLEPGVFAIPADAVTVEPPEHRDGFARVFNDGTWSYVEDHRGAARWTQKGHPVVIETLGPIPEELADTTPLPPPSPSPEQVLSQDLMAQFTADDLTKIKAAVDSNIQFWGLWSAMQAQKDPMVVTNARFLAGWGALVQVLGKSRMGEIAKALGVDKKIK